MFLYSIREHCSRLYKGATCCSYSGDMRHDLNRSGGIRRITARSDVRLVGKYHIQCRDFVFTLYGVCLVEK